MIKSQKNILITSFLNNYVRFVLSKNFKEINFIGDNFLSDKSLLITGNHISFWDGFWINELNRKILKKEFFYMMLEEELRKRILLRYNGAFSINPGNRSVIDSMKYTLTLLSNPDNAVLFYPQGEIKSHYDENFEYNKGVNYILKRSKNAFEILLLASFTDYLSDRKPIVNIYYKLVNSDKISDYESLRKLYQQYYQESKINHIKLIST